MTWRALLLSFVLFPSAVLADDFALICPGMGTTTETKNVRVSTFGEAGQVTYSNGTATSAVNIPGIVRVTISGNEGRILVPKALLPPIRGKSEDGWRQFDQLVVGEDKIAARFTLNVLNKPKIRIDRQTGAIELNGLGRLAFSGICELDQNAPGERKF